MALSVFFTFVLLTTRLAAQSTGTITGTVTDPSGAVIQGADVVCTNTETHMVVYGTTSLSGLFAVPDLPVGSYTVTVSQHGFKTLTRSGIRLLTEHTVDLSLVLQLGESSQSVTVDAPPTLVQATTSDVQTTTDSRQMSDLPLNGRNPFQLAELTPGATSTVAGSTPGQQENVALSVNGQRSTANNWELDSANYTNKQSGSAPTLPNPDTLQEFTVLASNFTAENKGGGAVVKLTTRSGTNDFHGSLFEFLRNDKMDALNFFAVNSQTYKQNQYGATAGGPIRANKLFYFGSFQGTHKRGSPSPVTIVVPLAGQHNGDFSGTGHTIVDPTTQAPFPNNLIPKSRWEKIGSGLLGILPISPTGSTVFPVTPPTDGDDYQFMVKVDYIKSEKDRFSARYFLDRNHYQRYVDSTSAFFGYDTFQNQTGLISWTHLFGPAWVMQASYNYLQTFRTETPHQPTTMQALGANVPAAQTGVPPQIFVNLTGYNRVYSPPGVTFQPATSEFRDVVSHTAGAHYLRFGGTFHRSTQYTLNNSTSAWGNWNFTAQNTGSTKIAGSGDAIAALLLGLPATFVQTSAPQCNFVSTLGDAWFQDDWKVNRRLTLNMGLRFDPWRPPHDQRGPLAGLVPGAQSTLAPLAPAGILFSGDPGVPAAIAHDHWKLFGPRAGLAWDVTGNGKNVVRGGYGIFWSGSEVFNLLRININSIPYRVASISLTSPSSTADPYVGSTTDDPFPYTQPSSLATYKFANNSAVSPFDPTLRPGYTQNWNLTLERQIFSDTALSVAYVGNHFLSFPSSINMNPAIYAPGATVANEASRRPFPNLAAVTLLTSFNKGYYDALQVKVTKRPVKGLIVMASYVYSKVIDLNSDNGVGSGSVPRNPFDRSSSKGPADFDNTQTLKLSTVYDLPTVALPSRALRGMVNGWQVNAIVTANTGAPFTCKSGVDNSYSGVGQDSCDQVLPNAARPPGVNPVSEWFNTAAFIRNAPGTFGNAGRNSLRGPGAFNVDASVFRHFRISERIATELRVEAYNVLNHPNLQLFHNTTTYSNSETVNASTFGRLIWAKDGRILQAALKVRF
jgi:hypothetical protein